MSATTTGTPALATGAPGAPSGPNGTTAPAATDDVSKQIRGSTLLLVGRMMSLGANLVVQVLLVRHFSKSSYGTFAYALSIATMVGTIVTLGLDRGVARFVAVYEERGDHAKLWGTIGMQLSTIVSLGAAAVLLAITLQGWIGGSLVHDDRIARLLAVMVVLGPIQALDDLLAGLFAVFAKPGAIFVRRYLLAPGLRMVVVALLLVFGGGLTFLGIGYVVTALIGLALYSGLLAKVLRERGLLGPNATPDRSRISFPIREVTAYTLPLVTTDILFVLLNTSDVVILGRTHNAAAIGSYRAVLPVARLNQLVMNSFALLFAPLMARLWARGDRAGVHRLYWQTAGWVAVMTFPLFALTFGLARPVTIALFGHRYASSAAYLEILAFAYYFNAALGFNGVTLKMLGHVRYAAGIAVGAGVMSVTLNLALIPRYGAMGAAIGTAITLSVYNVLKQLGLRLDSGIKLFEPRYLPLYLTIVGGAGSLFAVQHLIPPKLIVALPVALVASALVLVVGRHELDIGETFPEVRRIPILGPWLAGPLVKG